MKNEATEDPESENRPEPIDEVVVGAVEQYGYPRQFVTKSLEQSDLNYATTAYHLLVAAASRANVSNKVDIICA